MRTTISLDDDLVAKTQALTGLAEKAVLLREALTALIQCERAKRLALLGGSEPKLHPFLCCGQRWLYLWVDGLPAHPR
jgi:hypothetical protein